MIKIKLTERTTSNTVKPCNALVVRPKISVKLSERLSSSHHSIKMISEIRASEVVATLASNASQKAAKRLAENVLAKCLQLVTQYQDYAPDFDKTPEQFMFLANTFYGAFAAALPKVIADNIKFMIEVKIPEKDFDSENDLGLAAAAYKKIYLSDPEITLSEMDMKYFYDGIQNANNAIAEVVSNDPQFLKTGQSEYTPEQLINRMNAFFSKLMDNTDISGRLENRYQLSSLLKSFINYKPILKPEDSDLNRINSVQQLKDILERNKQKYDVYFRSKISKDAPGGTESYGTITATVNVNGKPITDTFEVKVAHNKAAACQLGDNTEWCTALPDTNYFKGYYSPDSPLFIFSNKEGTLKYQLVAGIPDRLGKDGEEIPGVQPALKDREDNPVDDKTAQALYGALIKINGVLEKYPSLRRFVN